MSYRADPFTHASAAPAARIAERLRDMENVVITAHTTPDGDAIGSMYALGFALQALGKKVGLCNESGLSDFWTWLPAPAPICTSVSALPFEPRSLIVLDCGVPNRIGENLWAELKGLPSVNIDHHIGTPHFGSIDNWVEPAMAATGQMCACIINALNIPMSKNIAESLYVAINSDSGSFSFDNVTPELFLLASWLMHHGCDVAAVRRKLDNQWTQERMRLWGDLFTKFDMHCNGRIVLCAVPLETLKAYDTTKEDLEGFVEQLRRLKNIDVAAIVREDAPSTCKISLRSSGTVDVRVMAQEFGGGGHRNAAGATLREPLAAASRNVLAVIRAHLGC